MRTLILVIVSVFFSLGCSTTPERAQKQQTQMTKIVAEFGSACSQLGYAINSDPWRDCVVQLAAKKDIQHGGTSTSIFGSWGNWGGGFSLGFVTGEGH